MSKCKQKMSKLPRKFLTYLSYESPYWSGGARSDLWRAGAQQPRSGCKESGENK